ncbi:hypothetical protein BC826DRAFT_1161698 [Russula brevipes]|nr:hypothetical protein BC826DRAFT_1161698 [Russula brevipes]
MTLSSSSRQHRKSMLPTPRLSSRLSSRRAASGDTSRIARRVPSPLVRTSGNNSSITQARAPRPAATYNLSLPDMGPRRAGSPSRIPWPSGQPSCPTPQEQSEASSLIDAPRPEVKRVDAQYSTPPAPAETKSEGSKGQEGRVIPTQHQDTENRDPALPARQTSRRPASTALTGFSRIENAPSSPRDSGPPALATKKSALARSGVSGKENRRPQTRTRVPAPPVTSIATITPRSVRRQPVPAADPSRASFRETSPRPLVIRKRPSRSLGTGASQGHSQVGPDAAAAAAAAVVVPEGINALMGDIDRFAKEWTEMFDDLFASADGREDGLSKLGAPTRIHPAPQSESAGDPLRTESPAAGKRAQEFLLPEALGTAASVGTSQTSALESSNGVHFNVTPASLARWRHRDNAMVGDAPVGEELERDLPGVASVLVSDPPTDNARHHPQKAVLPNASLFTTPQASRYVPALPEINLSSVISASHLVEVTSEVSSNRKDAFTKLLFESPLTTPRGMDTPRRNGTSHYARYFPPATVPKVSSSPLPAITSFSSVALPYSSPPWVNLRAHELPSRRSQRASHAASDLLLTRSSSLRGLRAIFKRTSAGLTGGQRQRAESLKDLISEPRVLSLGSVSISNLRDVGVASGSEPPAGPEESAVTMGDEGQVVMHKKEIGNESAIPQQQQAEFGIDSQVDNLAAVRDMKACT